MTANTPPRSDAETRREIDRLRRAGKKAIEAAKDASWVAKQDRLWGLAQIAEADRLAATLTEPQND